MCCGCSSSGVAVFVDVVLGRARHIVVAVAVGVGVLATSSGWSCLCIWCLLLGWLIVVLLVVVRSPSLGPSC